MQTEEPYTFVQEFSELALILQYLLRDYSILPLDAAIWEVSQRRYISFSKKAVKNFGRKQKCNPKLSARDEYVAIHTTTYSAKDSFEF